MFVTIINIITGESKTGSLKEISKQTNKSIEIIKQFKRNKVTLFGEWAISFNHQYIKQPRTGTPNNLKKYLQKKYSQSIKSQKY